MKFFVVAIVATFSLSTHAADLSALESLFVANYDKFYQERRCGENIERLYKEAQSRGLDLSNAVALKIVGSGFLETSGFYTRDYPNRWKMLGYFHVVLLADGYVFDFDLAEPRVLSLEEYVRLQFTPPYQPFIAVANVTFDPRRELVWWKATKLTPKKVGGSIQFTAGATEKLTDLVDLESVLRRDRK